MTDRQEPCTAIQRRSEVVPVSFVGVACVERHPDPEGCDITPIFGIQSSLDVDCRLQRHPRRREGRAELIPSCGEHHTVSGLDGQAHDRVVTREGTLHRVWVLLPSTGASLDVGEEKGHRPGWGWGHEPSCSVATVLRQPKLPLQASDPDPRFPILSDRCGDGRIA